ncbi:hypothetical protein [Rhizobium sp. WSM1325]|uniref:hypothetical protein n=1 Tax=Rhizobium sp. WSM1325 TaxID=3444086 RepID=UPI0032B01DFE
MNEASKDTDTVSAAAEAEKKYLVAFTVMFSQKTIGTKHIVVQAIACAKPQNAFCVLANSPPGLSLTQRSNARVVIHNLIVFLLKHPIQLENIGHVHADFVAGSITADDDVLGQIVSLPSMRQKSTTDRNHFN